jgi:hypothetical protein
MVQSPMKNRFFFFSLVLLLIPISQTFAQSHSPAGQAQALRGLRSLTLVVVVGWTGAKSEDPTKDQVWATVAKRLRDAGIDVRREKPGTEPDIALRLWYSYARVEDTIYSSSYLQLTEQVIRVRQPSANMWGSTWEWHLASWGSSHHIDDAIDRFLYDYRQANPEKRLRSGRRPTQRRITFWSVAQPIPPDHARIANFSYTLRAHQMNDPQYQRELEILDREIRAIELYPTLTGSAG